MRLLNTQTRRFQEFYDAVPVYAILSHRWSDDEVTYQDFLSGKRRQAAGFRKIIKACELASTNGYIWIWIDTCCINKESSAELTEAINAMWCWYRDAAVCFVYLNDVHLPQHGSRDYLWKDAFKQSEWFSRGWTLQELLAPKFHVFFSSDWIELGSKLDLAEEIAQAASIPKGVITMQSLEWMNDRSAAEKLSWASKRQTTRIEDTAYCLLGLLEVAMPLLYGEGAAAFIRLQEEILRVHHDESILAWRHLEVVRNTSDLRLLAKSPASFTNGAGIKRFYLLDRQAFEITGQGVRLDTFVIPMDKTEMELVITPLNCYKANAAGDIVPVGLLLLKQSWGKDNYLRAGIIPLDDPHFRTAQRMLEKRLQIGNSLLRVLIDNRYSKVVIAVTLPFVVNALFNLPRMVYLIFCLLPCWAYLLVTDPWVAARVRWGLTQRRVVYIRDKKPAGVERAAAWMLAQVFMGDDLSRIMGFGL